MKAAMVFPSRESEKAISGYSSTLSDSIKKSGVKIDYFTYSAGKPKSLFSKINELKKYDLVHIQHEYNLLGNYGLPFFILYFLLNFSKCQIITTMHTVLSQKEKFRENKIKTFLRKTLYFVQNRWINLFSDVIIVHADFFKDILHKEYNVPKNKIEVLPQGIIEKVPIYGKKKSKKELNLSGNVFLIMGSMVPDHGHDIIIKQADKINGTVLVVANPGSVNDRNAERVRNYIRYNKKIAENTKIKKHVRFDINENITDKNPIWWKYFSAADLVILSYRGGIGSGILAHSIAAKKPVIGSNIQYFREISKKFGCIKISKEENDYPRIIKESMHKKNYKKMVEECERYLKENGLSNIAEKYKKIYLSIKK